MMTNKTPIEALNEILELPKPCTNHCVDCQLLDDELCCYPNKVRYIAEQALTPQQKTFTVDEIKEILFSFCDDDCSNPENPNICKLGGFDCRKCIMKKFEKEMEVNNEK